MEVAYQKRGVKLVDGFFDKEDYNEEHCVFGVQPVAFSFSNCTSLSSAIFIASLLLIKLS